LKRQSLFLFYSNRHNDLRATSAKQTDASLKTDSGVNIWIILAQVFKTTMT